MNLRRLFRCAGGAYTPTPSPSPSPTPTPSAAISPGGAWNGTAGSGGTNLSASATARGTGVDVPPAAGLSIYRNEEITSSTYQVMVYGDLDDDDAIESVVFELEGGTTATVTSQSKHPTHNLFGFPITLTSATDGVAILRALVRPKNGLEYLIQETVELRINSGWVPDRIRYVDPNGDDSDGTTLGKAWKTPQKALSFYGIGQDNTGTASGAVIVPNSYEIRVTPADYLDTTTNTPDGGWKVDNQKKIKVAKNGAGTARVKRADGNFGTLYLHTRHVEFHDVEFDMKNIESITGLGYSGGRAPVHVWVNAPCIDSAGPVGPISFGYPNGFYSTDPDKGFRTYDTQYGGYAAMVSTSGNSCLNFGGFRFLRAVSYVFGNFANHFSNSSMSDTWHFDFHGKKYGRVENRMHAATEVVPTGVSYNSGTGLTTLTFAAGTLDMTRYGNRNGPAYVRVLTGSVPAGPVPFPADSDGTRPFAKDGYSCTFTDAQTMVVTGDLSGVVANTDKLRAFTNAHSDVLPFFGVEAGATRNITNIVLQNGVFDMNDGTYFLLQTQGKAAFTLTASGTTVTGAGIGSRLIGDCITLETDANLPYRFITSIVDANTVKIDSGFASDFTAQSCSVTHSLCQFAATNVVILKAAASATPGDFQHAFFGGSFRNTAFLGQSPGAGNQFLLMTVLGANGNGRFGIHRLGFRTSIIGQLAPNGGAFPTVGFTGKRNRYMYGTNRDTDGGGSVGVVNFSATYASFFPTSGLTDTVNAKDVAAAPYDLNGVARTTASLIGPVVA